MSRGESASSAAVNNEMSLTYKQNGIPVRAPSAHNPFGTRVNATVATSRDASQTKGKNILSLRDWYTIYRKQRNLNTITLIRICSNIRVPRRGT